MRTDLPAVAAWRHKDAREGFEVVFQQAGNRFSGTTTAVEAGEAWIVEYDITLDSQWRTVSARVKRHSVRGVHEVLLESAGPAKWRIDGKPAPHLDGCFDVDLESSSFTNAFPVHRLQLAIGASADAPAAWVRVADLSVQRLDQRYTLLACENPHHQLYRYVSPDLVCDLVFDEYGLVLDYPGLAVRVA
ncbi:MAG TPA: putative glycolipid-binding domain-containing protein [Steroidobacteraceae bacterium]